MHITDWFPTLLNMIGHEELVPTDRVLDGCDQSAFVASSSDRRISEAVQTAKVVVSAQGYEPAKVTLRAGTPARMTFVRTTDKTCGTEVVFPSLNIKRALPLNEPVVIEFAAAKAGDIALARGSCDRSGWAS